MTRPDAPIGFRPVTADDLPLLARWLRQPHMREWWGNPEEEIGFVRDMIEGRDTTRPFLIMLGSEAVGYIQVWYIGHHQHEIWLKDHPWLAELPGDAVGVDLSIGEAELISKGIGSRAARSFAEMLVSQGHSNIVIDPDPANLRAVRAYEKAGFRAISRLEGRTGDVHLMHYDPNARASKA